MERYKQSGEYYIKDTILNKKINYKQAIHVLNMKEKIITDKTETLQKHQKLLKIYEKNLKEMENERNYYKTILKKLIG